MTDIDDMDHGDDEVVALLQAELDTGDGGITVWLSPVFVDMSAEQRDSLLATLRDSVERQRIAMNDADLGQPMPSILPH